ncbi:MAG: 2-amino-4-hydroxy-6-hydroxymethyldihydropteridine diphosphokinase, partial [Pseudomonadota bacterium]
MLAQVGAKKLIGIGSNIEPREGFIRTALKSMESYCQVLRTSAVYETAALLTDEASEDWNAPFLNLAAEIEFSGSAHEFLKRLKDTEAEIGRETKDKWAPRVIDLDILFWGQECIRTKDLAIPHPEIKNRSFVLTPLRDLVPSALAS